MPDLNLTDTRMPDLHCLRHWEEKAAGFPAVDRCQFGSEEDKADNKNLVGNRYIEDKDMAANI